MNDILRESAIPALHDMGLRFLIDPGRDGERHALVVPFVIANGVRFLIDLEAHDGLHEMIVMTNVLSVPPRRSARVAQLLAELNARFKYVTFSMHDGDVWADVCLDFAHTADAQSQIQSALHRLIHALEEAHPDIARTAAERRKRPRIQREVEAILDDMPF